MRATEALPTDKAIAQPSRGASADNGPEQAEASRDPDLIHPGETIKIPIRDGQATQPAKLPPPARAEVRQDLEQRVALTDEGGVKTPPTSELGQAEKRLLKGDPVSQAKLELTLAHKDDPAYLKELNDVAPRVRGVYTKEQVQDHLAKDDVRGALEVLDRNMAATENTTHREALFAMAGKPYFTQAFFEQRIGAAAPETVAKLMAGGPGASPDDPARIVTTDLSPAQRAERIGDLLQDWGGVAPPEVADTVLDAVRAELPAEMLDGTLFESYAPGGASFYRGLSRTVEAADALGGNRARDVAEWLLQDVHEPQGDGPNGFGARQAGEIMLPPLADAVRATVAEGDGARLSVALINELPNVGEDSRYRQEDSVRSTLLTALASGLEDLGQKASDATDAWDKLAAPTERIRRDFQDPQNTAPDNPQSAGRAEEAIAAYRARHPDFVADLEAARREAGRRGADIARATMAAMDLQFDPESASGGEQDLVDGLDSINADPNAIWAARQSLELQRELAEELAFAEPGLTLDTIDAHVAHVSGVLAELALPEKALEDLSARAQHQVNATKEQIRSLTETWAGGARQALRDNDPQEAIAATLRYESGLKEVLSPQPGNQAEQIFEALKFDPDVAVQSYGAETLMFGAYLVREGRNLLWATNQMQMQVRVQKVVQDVWAAQRNVPSGEVRQPPAYIHLHANETPGEALRRNLDQLAGQRLFYRGLDKPTMDTVKAAAVDFIDNLQAEQAKPHNQGHLSKQQYKILEDRFFKETAGVLGGGTQPADITDPRTRAGGILTAVGAATWAVDTWAAGQAVSEERAPLSTHIYLIPFAAGAVHEGMEVLYGARNGYRQYFHPNSEVLPKLASANPTWRAAVGSLLPASTVGGAFLTAESIRQDDWLTAGLAGTLTAGDGLGWASRFTRLGALGGPVGWVGTGISSVALLGLTANSQYNRVQASNENEWHESPAIRDMARSIGFTDAQGEALFNNTHRGVSPMQAVNAAALQGGHSTEQMITYLQELEPEQIETVVAEAHHLIDGYMDHKTGEFPKAASDEADRQAGQQVTEEVRVAPRLSGPADGRGPYAPPPDDKVTITEMAHAESLRGFLNFLKNSPDLPPFDLPPAAEPKVKVPEPKITLEPPQPSEPPATATYTVEEGDTLWDIARAVAILQRNGEPINNESISRTSEYTDDDDIAAESVLETLTKDILPANPRFAPELVDGGW